MTDSDIVAELRRLYEAAIQHAGDLDETASVLALNIAVVHHLPALLDAVDTLRWYADEDNYDPESGAPGQWENVACAPSDPDEWDFEVDCGSIARTALAALKRSGDA